jgi:hypothetical protein
MQKYTCFLKKGQQVYFLTEPGEIRLTGGIRGGAFMYEKVYKINFTLQISGLVSKHEPGEPADFRGLRIFTRTPS